MADYRLGIDLGGTKIEIVALDRDSNETFRHRAPTPHGDYEKTVLAVRDIVLETEAKLGCIPGSRVAAGQATSTLGIGTPGSIVPQTGLLDHCNAEWLNGRPFDKDIEAALDRPIRMENDANCFTLSEAADGAGVGKNIVFGVILGTGMGGGIVAYGRLLSGLHRLTGEWGHLPLPWLKETDLPLRQCFCGQEGCQERYLCGQALATDWLGEGHVSAKGIADALAAGDEKALHAFDLYTDRMARACARMIDFLDPDVIVLGGGVTNLPNLCKTVSGRLSQHITGGFPCMTPIVMNKHGDSSGVRGAAWLWDAQESGDWPQ
ncbi:ROK family protein [Acetobacteraceae bacterium]|nr:ROK family protein [Acetobacteraceae bacterium]